LRGLWRGEWGLARAFGLGHVLVWVLAVAAFQAISLTLGMGPRRAVGTPLGLLFAAYNGVALVGVVRSARHAGRGVLRWMAPPVSVLLTLAALWVPLYFWGRPLIVLSP
jgi:hypothetical protein